MGTKVLVTGATGFIGGSLTSYLTGVAGYQVKGTSRVAGKRGGVEYSYYDISKPFSLDMLDSIDVLIHCATDFSASMIEENIQSTMDLCYRYYEINPRGKFIFVSSFSSRKDAQTAYGKAKYKTELALKHTPAVIIRPGFVLGAGGLFYRLVKMLKVAPVVPMFDGGKGILPVIGIDKLCQCIALLIEREHTESEYNLFEEKMVTLDVFFRQIALQMQRRILFISIPSSICLFILKLVESVGISLPVGHDNLKAFVANQDVIYNSSFPLLGVGGCSINESIFKAYKFGGGNDNSGS